jgi:hypothetical protein
VDPQGNDLDDLNEDAADENDPSGQSAGVPNGASGRVPKGSARPVGNGTTASLGPNGAKPPRVPRSSRILARTALRRESLALRTALLTRPVRTAADVARIKLHEAQGKALMIYPPLSVPPVSRLTTDPKLLAAGLESGRQAARDVFAP